jgi:hypothetical protein
MIDQVLLARMLDSMLPAMPQRIRASGGPNFGTTMPNPNLPEGSLLPNPLTGPPLYDS